MIGGVRVERNLFRPDSVTRRASEGERLPAFALAYASGYETRFVEIPGRAYAARGSSASARSAWTQGSVKSFATRRSTLRWALR